MPFSRTEHCTEQEWTEIFQGLIKPAVEGARELGYECRRSIPTRGNLVRAILEDLQSAHVVIADLTDRNANVFYELGIRHALTNRTILISQDRNHIPFDHSNYANHVYDWRSVSGRKEFAEQIVRLLIEVDEKPDRPDNPVSDFLGSRSGRLKETGTNKDRLSLLEEQVQVLGRQLAQQGTGTAKTTLHTELALEWASDHSLLDELPKGLSLEQVCGALAASRNEVLLRSFMRRSERVIAKSMSARVAELARRPSESIQRQQIPERAAPFIAEVQSIVEPIERFAIACIEVSFVAGIKACIHLAGSLISLSGQGGGIRFAIGLPAYIGWRMLLLMGATAVHNEDYDAAGIVINDPIEVTLIGGQVSYEPLWAQKRLFHPETFLGHADFGIKSVSGLWAASSKLREHFDEKNEFDRCLVEFLVLIAIRYAHQDAQGKVEVQGIRQNYPGYLLIDGSREALQRLIGRLQGHPKFVAAVAKILGMDDARFTTAWPAIANILNSAELGSDYVSWFGPEFPTSLKKKPR